MSASDLFGVSEPGLTTIALETVPDGVALRIEARGLSVLVPLGRAVCRALGQRLVELAAEPAPHQAPPVFPFAHRTLAEVAADEASHG